MARRKTPVLRNLDDPLRILNLLSLRSCGLVLIAYAGASGLELALGLFTAAFGSLAFLGQLAVAGLVAVALAIAERADDEHLVPSALRYYAIGSSRYLWGGMGEGRGPGRRGDGPARG